jgi:hypothetical protein
MICASSYEYLKGRMYKMAEDKTLRLLMPQWQVETNLPGAHLLNWSASKTNGPFEEVPDDLDASLSSSNKK